MMAVSMTLGFVLIGALTDRLGRVRIRPMAVAVAGMVLTMMFLAVVTFDLPLPVMPVLVLLSFFSASGPLVYAGLSQVFPRHLTGRVNTSLNLLSFIANFLLQWGIGMIIDLWPTTAAGGYDPTGYKAGLGLALGLQATGLGLDVTRFNDDLGAHRLQSRNVLVDRTGPDGATAG
jgi:MFS family permease